MDSLIVDTMVYTCAAVIFFGLVITIIQGRRASRKKRMARRGNIR